jgi:Holliday junction resolvasome RuvABC endonuclease subunit
VCQSLPKPILIAYEQAHHRGGAATEVGVGLSTRVQEVAALLDIPHYVAVHTATLKKWATGKGTASKDEMKAAARRLWGVEPSTFDEADALCLLAYARDTYAG